MTIQQNYKKNFISQNRIDDTFKKLSEEGKKALIVYIMAGDPDLQRTEELVLNIADAGADIIELGVPFSDPLADGPVIQEASQRALASGANLESILGLIKNLRIKTQIPIVLMTYYNPVYKMGLSEFVKSAALAGVDGMIVPDLPHEECQELLSLCDEVGLSLVPLIAPTTTPERMKKITGDARGFVYCVSLTGVTGMRDKLSPDITDFITEVRNCTDMPLAVGFGISNREQAARMSEICDGIIVGSAVVKIIEEYGRTPILFEKVNSFVKSLKDVI